MRHIRKTLKNCLTSEGMANFTCVKLSYPLIRSNFLFTSARYLEMAVPKRKTTPSKRNMRRAHDAIKSDAYVENPDTGELHRPHHIDLKTGMYRGRQVLKVKERY